MIEEGFAAINKNVVSTVVSLTNKLKKILPKWLSLTCLIVLKKTTTDANSVDT